MTVDPGPLAPARGCLWGAVFALSIYAVASLIMLIILAVYW